MILATSILIRLGALAWSLLLLRQARDWRMAFLTAMLALMALRQALTLYGIVERAGGEFPLGTLSEIPGLIVSVLAALAVFFLHSILKAHERATQALRSQQAQLVQVQKMEALGTLAGGMAHDFNNLLTAIRGNAELAKLVVPEQHPAHEHLTQICDVSDRAADLTRRILTFAGHKAVRLEVQDPTAILLDVAPVLRRLVAENIELTCLPDERVAPIKADKSQLEQVIINLAVNASDAMPDGGKLLIRLENDDSQKPDAIAGVKLAVSDTGPGIPDAVRTRLFEPFFTTKAPGKGTGLGLSTCYAIVRALDGNITVNTGPRGTTFEVWIPAAERSLAPSRSMAAPRPEPGGHESILLVEDEPEVRLYAQGVLEKAGYTVTAFADGTEALRQVRGGLRFDVLVSDVVMPQMSGPELAQQLKRELPTIGIVFVSGYPQLKQRDIRFDAASVFLPKPFTGDALKQAVRRVLETRPANLRSVRIS